MISDLEGGKRSDRKTTRVRIAHVFHNISYNNEQLTHVRSFVSSSPSKRQYFVSGSSKAHDFLHIPGVEKQFTLKAKG